MESQGEGGNLIGVFKLKEQQMNGQRVGKFYVNFSVVEKREILPVLTKMEFVPMRVEALYYENQFEYIGSSPIFDKLEEGMAPPLYNVIVNDRGSELTVLAKRV